MLELYVPLVIKLATLFEVIDVPLTCTSVGVPPLIVIFPLPNSELLLIVLILVPETKVSCLSPNKVFKSVVVV